MIQREKAYRIYVTDSLQYIPQQQYLQDRFYDLTYKHKKVDNRTGEQIVADTIKSQGLILKGELP